MRIVEVKRHLDGREERFVCDVIELVPGERAVVLWQTQLEEPLCDGPLFIPAGPLVTWGYFWTARPYLVYKMTRPDGRLWGHRFDICTDVEITEREIRYLDLIVDVWVDAQGQLYVLDEDELVQARERRLLRPEHERVIDAALRELKARYPDVLAELKQSSGSGITTQRSPPRGTP
jgi:predicted RNA-binding protein associated with RNAse of E/G family